MRKICIAAGGRMAARILEALGKRGFETVFSVHSVREFQNLADFRGAEAAVFFLPDGTAGGRVAAAVSACPIPSVIAVPAGIPNPAVYEGVRAGAFGAAEIDPFGDGGFDELAWKLSLAADARSVFSGFGAREIPAAVPIAAIGASTGGPGVLAEILSSLPSGFAGACAIVQHMDSEFSESLADWLAKRSSIPVAMAEDSAVPKAGRAYVSRADADLFMSPAGAFGYRGSGGDPFCPSIDFFFKSLVGYGRPGCAVLLTGMGCDGAAGMLALRGAGWRTIAQDEATSAVYGMPKTAAETGAASEILGADKIGPRLASIFGALRA